MNDVYNQVIVFGENEELNIAAASKNGLGIGVAASTLNITVHALRKYERDFNLNILRNGKDHRYYTEKDMRLLEKILEWKRKGYNREHIRYFISAESVK